MAKLAHKTKDQYRPQLMDRAYLSCHPNDLQTYLEPICDDLQRDRDIVVYYDREPGTVWDPEEIGIYLGRMQVFIFPVTSRSLSQPDRAREIEFKFAIEHHIPVLPILMEEGLAPDLERICGGLPYLDRSAASKDTAAAPYRAELDRLLSLALKEGRTSTDQVGRYAPFPIGTRTVAGGPKSPSAADQAGADRADAEDYESPGICSIISEAEQGSPEAMERLSQMYRTGEGVERDRSAGARWLETLAAHREKRFDATGADADGEALIQALGNVSDAWREMGLYAPARDALVRMEAVVGRLAETSGYQDERVLRILADIKDRRGSLYDAEHEYWGAFDNYEMCIEFTRRNVCDNNRIRYIPAFRAACLKMGDLRAKEWLTDDGYWYCRGIEIAPSDPNDAEDRRLLSSCYIHLGGVLKAGGDLSGARGPYEQGVEMIEQLARETGLPEHRYDLFTGYLKMGELCLAEEDRTGADQWYGKCVELTAQFAGETDPIPSRRGAAACYQRLGRSYQSRGSSSKATRWYERCLEMRKRIAEETDAVEDRQDLSFAYESMGDAFFAQGITAEAVACYESSVSIWKRLARETDAVQFRLYLADAYQKLGDVRGWEDRLSMGRPWYEKSFALREQIYTESGCSKSWQDLADSYLRLGDFSREEGDLAEARRWYEKYQKMWELVSTGPYSDRSFSPLSIGYVCLGIVAKETGDLSQAKGWIEKGLKKPRSCDRISLTLEFSRSRAVGYHLMGDLCQAKGELSKARVWHEKGLRLRESMMESLATEQALLDLCMSYRKMGDLCSAEGDLAQAKHWYEDASTQLNVVLLITDTPRPAREKCVIHEKLGDLGIAQGDMVEGIGNYEMMVDLCRWIAEWTQAPEDRRSLGRAYQKLARSCLIEGDISRSCEWCTEGIETLGGLELDADTVQIYDDLAALCYDLGTINAEKPNFPRLEQAELIWSRLTKHLPEEKMYQDSLARVWSVIGRPANDTPLRG